MSFSGIRAEKFSKKIFIEANSPKTNGDLKKSVWRPGN
jgi:hypothetical protein